MAWIPFRTTCEITCAIGTGATGVAALLERLQPRRRLAVDLLPRGGEAVAHGVHLARELADLVALRQGEPLAQVAEAHAARLAHEALHGPADEREPRDAREEA